MLVRLRGRIRFTRASFRLLKLSMNAPDAKSSVAPLEGIGTELMSMGKLKAAERILKIAISNDSSEPATWFNLAHVRFERRNFDGALEAYGRAAHLAPWKAEHHGALGYVLLVGLARYREALDAFDRSIGCGTLDARILRLAMCCAYMLDDARETGRLLQMIVRNFDAEMGRTVCDGARQLADHLAAAPIGRKRGKHSHQRIMELAIGRLDEQAMANFVKTP
jgi:tetratricopeptide (TPR) repeat protein